MDIYKHRRKLIRMLLTGILPLSFFLGSIQTTSAYKTGASWGTVSGVYYGISPTLDSDLRISGTEAIINNSVIPHVNQTSWFNLFPTAYEPTANGYAAAIFPAVLSQCGTELIRGTNLAVTCGRATGSPPHLVNRFTFFNSSLSHAWNTSGMVNCLSNPPQFDFKTVALHETGHWFRLADVYPGEPHSEAVMNFGCSLKQSLLEDDKMGIVQLYGPRTGFESGTGYAMGISNTPETTYNVTGYFNSSTPPPELGSRGTEFSVPQFSGSRYEMMSGYATSAFSFIYNKLFTEEQEIGPGPRSYLKISSGMKLRWYQYNFQQSTMGLDFRMTSGETLHGSAILDQNGVSVHPAARGVYRTGVWFYTEVDLTPLAGRTIDRWYIAYDNGNNGTTGQFRAYFDNVRVQY